MNKRHVLKIVGLVFSFAIAASSLLKAEEMLLWVGAVTHDSARLIADISPETDFRLEVESAEKTDTAILSFSRKDALNPTQQPLHFDLNGLQPQTQYNYRIVPEEGHAATIGSFQTFPSGPASFTFIFASCAGGKNAESGGKTASEHPVFERMAEEKPLLYLMTGDLHYSDIAENDSAIFANACRTLFESPPQRHIYRTLPFIYMWDDHDFGPNNSDITSPSRQAALAAYRQFIPHYPLALPGKDAPVAQSFAVGRVKFIMADQRSSKSYRKDEDTPEKSVLGAAQKAWLKEQLIDGRDNYALTIWVGSFPWIAKTTPGEDHWGGYSHERHELANFIQQNNIHSLVMLCGDAHMIAADDGSHNRYDDDQSKGFPVLHAAALHRTGSVKGGPYSEGAFGNPDNTYGQYGVFKINDDGISIHYQYTGKRVNADGDPETLITLKVP